MRQLKKAYPKTNIRRLCLLFDVPASSYYHAQQPNTASAKHQYLIDTVKSIHSDVDKTYGKRRIRAELLAMGIRIGLYKTASLMKEANVIASRPRKKHRYAEHESEHKTVSNVLQQAFNPGTLDTHYVGDITYLRTYRGFAYLAAVMDLGNREIVGWAIAHQATAELAQQALDVALQKYKPDTKNLLFHTDQGCQYTARHFQDYLTKQGITPSMSRRGNCLDNAVMERFFRSLKTERLNNIAIVDHGSAKQLVEDYIRFYNYRRRHSSIGYIAPVMKRLQMKKTA